MRRFVCDSDSMRTICQRAALQIPANLLALGRSRGGPEKIYLFV